MTPEAQRIAIAESLGELNVRFTDSGLCIASIGGTEDGTFWGTHGVPDYLNDLNAMHEAESFIRNAQDQMKYASETLMAMGFDDLIEASDLNVDYCWHAMGATAAQRAEAFLKTLNLWKP